MKKIKFILISIIVVLTATTVILLNYERGYVVLENNNTVIKKYSESLSMMLETGSGTGMYEVSTSTSWSSTEVYTFNSSLSRCENGSTLTWNDTLNAVVVTGKVSDRCYVYFDINADVIVATNNSDNSYNTTTPATLSCSNGSATYNQQNSAIEVSSLNGYVNCTLTYSTPSTITYLNDYIISLTGTTQGNGEVVDENGYRYEGKNPDNFVLFNGELWRIIGVFDSDSHGVSNTNLVKIVRYTQIGGYAWDTENSNNWSTASLRTLLNTYYYNATDGTDSGYCYMTSTTVPNKCDFTINGINSTYRSMVQQVTWYLGGYSSTSATADTFYSAERGTDVYSGNATSVTDYIALMYPSDMGYSVLSSNCARTTNLDSYGSTSCSGSSWIYQMSSEPWFLTHYTGSSTNVFVYYTSSVLSNNNAQYGYTVHPTLYLKSSVYLLDGTGDIDDPYVIAMD